LRVDIAFIGTNGISLRHGLSTPDSDEAAVKRAMIGSANYVVVVADSSKVGREDFVSFAALSSVDALVTDSELSGAYREQLTEQGIEVVNSARQIGIAMYEAALEGVSAEDREITVAVLAKMRGNLIGQTAELEEV